MESSDNVVSAYIVINCKSFQPTLDFFTKTLAFRVLSIYPADDPRTASISAHSLTLKINCNGKNDHTTLEIQCRNISDFSDKFQDSNQPIMLTAPNGTEVIIQKHTDDIEIPPLQEELVISRVDQISDSVWTVGRAGMRYRDLLPGRLGGRYVASHIHIPTAGLVPDYVHYHKVQFQVIYCYKSWVRVVYEDQGEPFILREGDCVVQPPEIRHRVLESGPDLEVIEVGCPAIHETLSELKITLPTVDILPDKVYGGQKFVRHISEISPWKPFPSWNGMSGVNWEAKLTGIGDATHSGDVLTLRPIPGGCSSEGPGSCVVHNGELFLVFVLAGKVNFQCAGISAIDSPIDSQVTTLSTADTVTIPSNTSFRFYAGSPGLQLLLVVSPAELALLPV